VGVERRNSHRYAVEGTILVEVSSPGIGTAVVDISVGGFALATRSPILGDGVQSFRFVSKSGRWHTTLQAIGVYATPEPVDRGPHAGKIVTGFQFLHTDDAAVRRQIEDLLAHAVGVVA
jgi:hypothetical protein